MIFTGLAFTSLSQDQYSYHHAKLFGVHNHLYLDPWNTDSVFLIDNCWGILQAVSTASYLLWLIKPSPGQLYNLILINLLSMIRLVWSWWICYLWLDFFMIKMILFKVNAFTWLNKNTCKKLYLLVYIFSCRTQVSLFLDKSETYQIWTHRVQSLIGSMPLCVLCPRTWRW